MGTRERSWPDKIRDLIDEADRVRGESERLRGHAERVMKQPFWPDRRRTPHLPGSETPPTDHHNDCDR